MARNPKRKPKTPAEIAAERIAARRQDMEAVNLQPDAAELPAQQDIEVTRAGQARGEQKARHDTARRLDAFEALRPSMAPGCYDAARRFELDLMIRRGENDRGQATERVNRTAGITTDAMLQAAQRLYSVLQRMSDVETYLMHELIAPSVDKGGWRGTVAYVTGETHTHAQAARVRALTVNLRDAYAAMDRRAAA